MKQAVIHMILLVFFTASLHAQIAFIAVVNDSIEGTAIKGATVEIHSRNGLVKNITPRDGKVVFSQSDPENNGIIGPGKDIDIFITHPLYKPLSVKQLRLPDTDYPVVYKLQKINNSDSIYIYGFVMNEENTSVSDVVVEVPGFATTTTSAAGYYMLKINTKSARTIFPVTIPVSFTTSDDYYENTISEFTYSRDTASYKRPLVILKKSISGVSSGKFQVRVTTKSRTNRKITLTFKQNDAEYLDECRTNSIASINFPAALDTKHAFSVIFSGDGLITDTLRYENATHLNTIQIAMVEAVSGTMSNIILHSSYLFGKDMQFSAGYLYNSAFLDNRLAGGAELGYVRVNDIPFEYEVFGDVLIQRDTFIQNFYGSFFARYYILGPSTNTKNVFADCRIGVGLGNGDAVQFISLSGGAQYLINRYVGVEGGFDLANLYFLHKPDIGFNYYGNAFFGSKNAVSFHMNLSLKLLILISR